MAYDNTNSGALFPNEKTKDSHPDYRGTINIDGKDYWISGWIKVSGPNSKNPGQKFMSLAATPKDDAATTGRAVNRSNNDFMTGGKTRNASAPQPKKPEQADFDSFDDDIPF